MHKRKLWKSIRKSITHSMGRFISIMLLMALGSFALVGLTVTGPDMRATGTTYFNELNSADLTILSDYGIDESERNAIEKASGIRQVEYLYLKDVVIKDTETSVRILSKPSEISTYRIDEGNLPEQDDEIAIDRTYQDKYKIGDTISFTEKADTEGNETLKRHDYKITGFISSSEIISDVNMGQTTAGTGELKGYAVVNSENFDSSVYMMAKLTFTDTENVDPYTDEYNDKIQEHKEELTKLLDEQQNNRFSAIKSEYQEKIDDGQKELDDGKKELEDARTELNDANTKIEEAKQEIADNEQKLQDAQKQISDAEKEIASNEKLLKQKQSEYNSAQKQYNSKKSDYENGVKELENKKTEYNAGNAQINSTQQDLDNKKQQLESVKAQYEAGLPQTQQAYEVFMNTTYNPGMEQINAAQSQLDAKKQELQTAQTQINEAEQQLASAKTQLDSAQAQLTSAKTQIDNGNKQLKIGKANLANAKKEYNNGKTTLANAKTELAKKENEYNEKLQEFNEKEPDAQKEIDENEEKLNDAQEKLEKLDAPTYSIDNRREIPGGDGYSVYETVSEIVDSLAKVFPVFLYFVAALVTFTTMTRFVSEERINNGTLKSLGYQDKDVIQKFVVYGFIAGMTGTVLGRVLGHTLLPHIVYNAYKHGFLLSPIELHFYAKITILAVILSLISSVLPAYAVAKGDLQETTASLLQPKAPKAGSKILLERITPIWKRMRFTQKVTARNIFRYKNRMFMTIFGVAGAASILFAGFSVKGSISKINEKQFEDIIKYDMIVAQNDDLDEEAKTEFNNLLNSDEIKSYSSVYYEEVTKVAGKNNDTQSIKLIIPENDDDFNQYISLADRKSQEKIDLQDDGIVISERLSKLLNVSKGDEITFTDSSNKERTAKVSGICEMYAGHFIFMNTTEYKNIYQKDCESNAKLLLLKDSSTENTNNQAAKFMELSAVKGIVQNTTLYNQINTIVNSLNQIMIVLIIVASMLAVVILYNLTNINVAERIRELCTIKVLGFYDNEVTMYIYKETIFLSIIGVIVGWIIGILLHTYILVAVSPAEVMFDPKVTISSYIVPAVVIAVVTFVLKYYVNNRLKVVDMLEALKSVD